MTRDEFWKLDHLTHSQLLESLSDVIRVRRRALAELIAHLAEVEERRLHLQAAHSSMFDYCVARLGMSEDEACRRIDLARLARSYPALYPLLASGEITLSVALVLKPILSQTNHQQLLAAARGKSIREARELVALHAPRPDVPASLRKLPERPAVEAPSTLGLPLTPSTPATPTTRHGHAPPDSLRPAPPPTPPPVARPPHHQNRIEPLSPQRYKIQFTVDKTVKDQLEQARDLLRHANPSGDLGAVIARALELLIADLLKRRFGAGARRKAAPVSPHPPESQTHLAPAPAAAVKASASRIPRAARRTVLERDGLACTWRDADGNRCASRAWLEIDHRHPRAKTGGSEPENLRILCRAHNQLAAEHEFGRAHIQRAIRARQQRATHTTTPPIPSAPRT